MVRWTAVGIAAILAHSAFVVEASANPVQWKKSQGGNNHWYQVVFVQNGINWVEAHLRATARGCGWYLATITSSAENTFVFDLVEKQPNIFAVGLYGPWLGAFQKNSFAEPAGNWRWVTNEAFAYKNWNIGEPNDGEGGSEEAFLHFWNNGAWNDAPVNLLPNGFVVEFSFAELLRCRVR